MHKQPPSLEWDVAASDAEWEHRRGALLPAGEPPAPRRPLQRYFWSVAALCLLLVSAGDWWWRMAQGRAHPARADVTTTAQPELGNVAPVGELVTASPPGHQAGMAWWYQHQREASGLRASIQTADPTAHLHIELHRLGFQGDQAMARAVTPAKNGAPAYRQTRFYRRTSTGWVQTEPDAALWGPERSLETPYFVYHFRQNDALAVVAILPQMDALYRIMRRNFGLPLTSATEKLVIDVSVTHPPGGIRPPFAAPNHFLVPSPAIYLAPVTLTDAELLEQAIALPLLNYLLAQASGHHALGSTSQPMWSGLYLWQVWDLELPLAAWRGDVVKWLYIDLPAVSSGQSFVLPERYTALCAAHKLWLPSPAQMNIPLMCGRPDWETQSFPLWRLRDPLTRLDQFVMPWRPGEYIEEPASLHQVPHPGQAMALATLIEYAVATYGREHLPALVAGLGHYDSWDTLLPAVYGASPAEFEAGWQAYLIAHYGVPSPLRLPHN